MQRQNFVQKTKIPILLEFKKRKKERTKKKIACFNI
jgi:hypothetical protein